MSQRKIDFFGEFNATGIDQSQANVYRQMAGVGSQLMQASNQLANVAAKKNRDRLVGQGKAQALSDYQEGIKPKLKDDEGLSNKAYNEASMLAYRMQVKRDTKETLNRLKNKFSEDPVAFDKAARGYMQGVTDGLPSEYAFIIEDDIKNSITANFVDLENNFYAKQKRENLADISQGIIDLEDEISIHARSGNNQALNLAMKERKEILKKGVSSGLLDPVQVSQADEAIKETVFKNKAVGQLETIFSGTGSIEEKISASSELITDIQKNNKDLNADQLSELVGDLRLSVTEQIKISTAMTAEEEKQNALETVELKLDAQYGRRSDTEVLSDAFTMFKTDRISEAEYLGIRKEIIDRQQKQTQQNIGFTDVSKRLKGDDSILVEQSDVDNYYKQNIEPALDQLSKEERIYTLVNFAQRLNKIPKGLAGRISNQLITNDIEQIQEAAQIIDALDELPGMEIKLKPHERAFASIVNDMQGMLPEQEAIQYAREITDPRNKALIEYRENEIKEAEIDYQSIVESELDAKFGFGTNIDQIGLASASKDYQAAFETLVKGGFDMDKAKSKALTLLKQRWNYSPTQNRVMKYPPEQYYAIQGQSDYIRNQLDSWVNKNALFGEVVSKSFLVSDSETGKMISNGLSPDYLIYVQTESGMLMPVSARDPKDGKTKYIRWSPDRDKEINRIKKKNEKAAKEKLDLQKELNEIANRSIEGIRL